MFRKIGFVVLSVVLSFTLFSCKKEVVLDESKSESKTEENLPLVSISGSAKNIDSDITATLLMNGNTIYDVEFTDDMEPSKKDRAKDLYAMAKEKILAENSFQAIDTISGATVTINAMKEATKNALLNNGYDLIDFGYHDSEVLPVLSDGAFTGKSLGMNGDVYVNIEVIGGALTNVYVATNSETEGIGAPLHDEEGNIVSYGMETPIQKLPYEILKNKSVNVDVVTGATVTSDAIKFATKDALKQAGATNNEFNLPIRNISTISEVDCDVLVVGAGGAGLVSAITAGETGAKVLIVDKNGVVGGNTLMCGGIYNSPDADIQNSIAASSKQDDIINEATKIEESDSEELKTLKNQVAFFYDDYKKKGKNTIFDAPIWFELQTYLGGDKIAKLPLLEVLTNNALKGLEFLKEINISFKKGITQGPGSLWKRTHSTVMNMGTGFISAYLRKLEAMPNVDLFVETKCTKILMSGNKTVGAICTYRDGTELRVNCKSVILATGGFSANNEMINKYNDHSKWGDLTYAKTTNRKTIANGDGITLATEIGADVCDMKEMQLLYLSETENGQIAKYPKRCVNAIDQVIYVNKEGKRFVNEDGRRDEICKAIMEQTDGIYYVFESGDGNDYEDIYDPSWRSADGFSLSYLVDNGYIVVSDTIEELCEKLSIDFDTFHDTIVKYDEGVLSHNDEFGRINNTTAFSKGPYIMTKRTTAIHHTMGGLVIDEEANVLDKDGNKIEGLFACGEVTGGIHGGNRLGGNAVTDTVVFGRIAGENAVK